MTFAEYLIHELAKEDLIWRNNWFGIIHDFPNLFPKLMPSNVIFLDDLRDERKNSRAQDLLRGTAKRQGILTFLLIIMRIDEKNVDKAIEHINELHNLRTQQTQYQQSTSSQATTSLQTSSHSKDYIFPCFDYKSCSQEEMSSLYLFIKNAFLDATKSFTPTAAALVEEVKDQSIYLNLQPFSYDILPGKLKAYINKYMGENIYKELFTKAIQTNIRVREITLNIKSIVSIHNNPEAYKWHLYGFANIYEIAQMFIDKYYAGIPKVKAYQTNIVNGLFSKGLLFIRNEYLSYFLQHLFEKVNFKNIENEISSAINPQYFEDLEKKIAKATKQHEPEKNKYSLTLSSPNLQSAILHARQHVNTTSTPIVGSKIIAHAESSKNFNRTEISTESPKSRKEISKDTQPLSMSSRAVGSIDSKSTTTVTSPRELTSAPNKIAIVVAEQGSPRNTKRALQPQLSEKIKDGTFRMARSAGSVDSTLSPREGSSPTSKKGLAFSLTAQKNSPPAIQIEEKQSPRTVDSPGRKPRSNTSPYPAPFMSELNSKIKQHAVNQPATELSQNESNRRQIKP